MKCYETKVCCRHLYAIWPANRPGLFYNNQHIQYTGLDRSFNYVLQWWSNSHTWDKLIPADVLWTWRLVGGNLLNWEWLDASHSRACSAWTRSDAVTSATSSSPFKVCAPHFNSHLISHSSSTTLYKFILHTLIACSHRRHGQDKTVLSCRCWLAVWIQLETRQDSFVSSRPSFQSRKFSVVFNIFETEQLQIKNWVKTRQNYLSCRQFCSQNSFVLSVSAVWTSYNTSKMSSFPLVMTHLFAVKLNWVWYKQYVALYTMATVFPLIDNPWLVLEQYC